nr:endonuclease/exonuclease/phosphatase family protein [Nocardioides sp. MAH-18]
MTANLYFGNADPAAVVDGVRDGDVDLLVVNEVTETSVAGLDAAGLADLLPHRAGEPAPDGDGTATMAFSREPISEVSRVPMLQDGWLFTTGGLVVAAVHAFAPNEPDVWRADHAALAASVAAHEPDLVVGDLNATVDHAPMRRLAAAGYRDAGELADAGWQPTWPAMRVGRIPGIPLAQIDHVLVGPRLTALDQHAVDLPGSDHEGLVAEVAPR